MKKVLKIAFLVAVFVISTAQTYAQTVSGKLLEATSGDPVGYATVSLTPKGATEVYKYSLSNDKGEVRIESVKAGTYTVKVELMGYKAWSQEIEVKNTALNLGEIKLEEDAEALEAAQVTDVTNPVIIKKDTVEYNASSFMTTDNDMLENLLKKLPGVEVGSDGSITANGETVTKIYIDGKTFFMDDPQLASQNIPAKMVEKVKVVKKKSEQAEFSGIDDGQEETVIDLSVQPSMMDGLFANVQIAGGHDIRNNAVGTEDNAARFQANAMIGKFKQNSQISLILNANNAGRMGFTDRFGGGGGGGFGGGGGGITTSWMGGLNGSFNLLDNKMELSSNYVYNGSHTISGSDTYRETFMTNGSTLYEDSSSSGVRNSDGHRIGVRLEHKFSDNTNIIFEPQVNFGTSNYANTSTTRDWYDPSVLNSDGWTSGIGDTKNWSTNGRLIFRQRLGLPGRTLTFNGNWNYSESITESFNQSLAQYATRTNIINQRSDQNQNSASLSGRLEYTEPLGNNFYASANYSYSWSRSTTDKKTYDSGDFDTSVFSLDNLLYNRNSEIYNDLISNSILNRYINQSAGVNFMYQEGQTRWQVGVSAMPRDTYNYTNGEEYTEKTVNWAPNASVIARFNDYSNLRLFYNGRSSQPSTSQLMPVVDNSNQRRMPLGNPYLISYFNHSLRTEYGYTNRSSFLSFRVSADGSYTTDPIVNATWYDDDSVQYSFPINGKPSWSGSFSIMLNSPIGKSNFRFSTNTSIRYNESHSYQGAAALNMDEYFNDSKDEFYYEKFHNDFFGDNATKSFETSFLDNKTGNFSFNERFNLTYRLDNFELSAGFNTRMSKPTATLNADKLVTTWSNTATGSMNWTIGQSGFGMSMDGNYNWYNGYTTDPGSNFILNAEISKLIFNNNATLAIRGVDLLNQTRNLSVSDSANYHTETRSLSLGRYVLVSLTFRFGTFGNRRNGGNRGGGAPGGGRPMGGPPMGGGMGRF